MLRRIKEGRIPILGAPEQKLNIAPEQAIAEGGSAVFRLDKVGVSPRLTLRMEMSVNITNAGAGPTGTIRPWNPSQFANAITVEAQGERVRRYDALDGESAVILASILNKGQAPAFDALTQAEARAIGTYAISCEIPVILASKDFAPYSIGALLTQRSDDVTVKVEFGTISDLVDNQGAGFAGTVTGTCYLTQNICNVDFDPEGYGAVRYGRNIYRSELSAGDNRFQLDPYKVHRLLMAKTYVTASTVPTLSDAVITRWKIDQGGGQVAFDQLSADVRNAMLTDFGLPPAGPRADSAWTGVYLIDIGKKDPGRPSTLSAALNGENRAQSTLTATMAAGLTVPEVQLVEATIEGLYV